MSSRPRHSRALSAGDKLIATLRDHLRDRKGAANVPAEAELALQHLQKLATLGQATADVAAEYGNLITVILGYTDMLLAAGESVPPPEREYLVELKRAAERASALTARLLKFSQQSACEGGSS